MEDMLMVSMMGAYPWCCNEELLVVPIMGWCP